MLLLYQRPYFVNQLRSRSLARLRDFAQAKSKAECPEQSHQRGHTSIQDMIWVRVEKDK
jgi:hypothetical protein